MLLGVVLITILLIIIILPIMIKSTVSHTKDAIDSTRNGKNSK
ncbi:MAG: hypothetical protein ACLTAI_13565 [Thomasclavelia sp.]